MLLEITLDDIHSVAELMGKDFSDAERTAILQTLASCDIQACPGSGKTTTMVAKLHILAGKLQGTNHGICALSHTNAARDEIKSSLGSANSSEFRYPHFIGTIQAFVDTFLTIPAYIKKYGYRPVMIDDEGYELVATRHYSGLTLGTQNFLILKRSRDVQQDDLKEQYAKDYFAKLSYRFDNLGELIYFDNNQEKAFIASFASSSYKDVLRVKQVITQAGYLTYHDAFAIGNWYLDQFPHLPECLAIRFPFVFFDEMQDTDCYQLALIDRIFVGRSVVQKFGDPNQAIYNHRSEEFERVWNPQTNFQITSSKRLSRSIASLSQSLGVMPQTIQGNLAWVDHNHTIICFDPPQAPQVIPAFANIVEQERLSTGPFMALGAVAKPHQQRLTIPSYWPSFERRLNRQTVTSSFWEDLALANLVLSQNKDLIRARIYLLNSIGKVLRYQNARTPDNNPFAASIFESEVKKRGHHQALNRTLLSWAQQLMQSSNIAADQLISDLTTVLGLIDVQLTSNTIASIQRGPNKNRQLSTAAQELHSSTNVYRHSAKIEVTVSTIHSAKGQTHQATLLLETFYTDYDLEKIKSYLWGKPDQKAGKSKTVQKRFLPLSYVACTRPTHLLCVAIQRSHLEDNERIRLENFGWRIMDL